jgi:hypothetical protein
MMQSGLPADTANPVNLEDMEYFSFHDFKGKLIDHYYAPDGSLFRKKNRFADILTQFGDMITPAMLKFMLEKSAFLNASGFIACEKLQKVAMNANRGAAFRYCLSAQKDPRVVEILLNTDISHIHDISPFVLMHPEASVGIVRACPFKLAWTLFRVPGHDDNDKIDLHQFSAQAIAEMACTWLSHPERVVPMGTQLADWGQENVTELMLRTVLHHLKWLMRNPDPSFLPLSARRKIEADVAELLGVRRVLAAELISWQNKLDAIHAGVKHGPDHVHVGRPLFEGGRPMRYTAAEAQAAFRRGAAKLHAAHEAEDLTTPIWSTVVEESDPDDDYLPMVYVVRARLAEGEQPPLLDTVLRSVGKCNSDRRGDAVLRIFRDQGGKEICETFLPMILSFLLDPAPAKFEPRWVPK